MKEQIEISPLKQRMYHLTCMYFAGIHAGIQSYHAGIEYALKYWKTPEFQAWAQRDKTVIVLNGSGSNSEMVDHYNPQVIFIAEMQRAEMQLRENLIPYAEFFEPMSNNTMTSIAVLADERVWDRIKYPDPLINRTGDPAVDDAEYMKELTKLIGPEAAFLREFLKPWRLAQ